MIKLEIVDVEIDGIKFQIQEFSWKKSLKIQKKLLNILTPVLDVLSLNANEEEEEDKNESFLDKLEIKNLGSAVRKCLLSIDDPFELFKEVFSSSYVIKTNESGASVPVVLDNDELLQETFHKKTLSAFKLIFQVLKVNELVFSNGMDGLGEKIISIFKSIMPQ